MKQCKFISIAIVVPLMVGCSSSPITIDANVKSTTASSTMLTPSSQATNGTDNNDDAKETVDSQVTTTEPTNDTNTSTSNSDLNTQSEEDTIPHVPVPKPDDDEAGYIPTVCVSVSGVNLTYPFKLDDMASLGWNLDGDPSADNDTMTMHNESGETIVVHIAKTTDVAQLLLVENADENAWYISDLQIGDDCTSIHINDASTDNNNDEITNIYGDALYTGVSDDWETGTYLEYAFGGGNSPGGRIMVLEAYPEVKYIKICGSSSWLEKPTKYYPMV